MDNVDQQNIGKSREEFIKLARESCAKNLNPAANRINTYNKKTSKGLDLGEEKLGPLKIFLVRFVCALAIFITVITISALDTRYETDYGNKIEELFTSNITIEKAEDFFVSLIEKFK